MPELISIEEAARITGFPYEEIEDWVKSRKITSFHTRTGTCMVDPENLRDFIAHIEHLGIQKLYLQLVIQDKEEEADEIIAQYDDYLFCLRSLKNISPLLKQIIAELSTFIDDKQDRYIFTEITSGAKILDVAQGENVYLRGFGSFVIKKRAQKTARNISKNTTIIIPEHNIPSFKPAKTFLNEVK